MIHNGVTMTFCGIYCSLCKRKIQRDLHPDATEEDFKSITDEIWEKHKAWHLSKQNTLVIGKAKAVHG